MKLVVIQRKRDKQIVAVVENPSGVMSKGAVALAWAKSEGFSYFPSDCESHEANLISYGTVQRKLTPVHELDKLEKDGKKV